ncbi:hypothetical protein [Pseudomonas monteilii]|uniref:Uncharacterized protein n=1 Tax=Pseudomonas monteilii TaxID=76759 RepID=A0A399M2Y9_9PSED|nr:hypothetical protein [Pseudomonas monteilii]RII75635.1 hypothetical protein D0894_21675 [Pseudomonas monteilii]
MNEKGGFNQAARGDDVTRAQQIKALQEARNEALKALQEDQRQRYADDLDKARRQILLAHSRPACRPDNARAKPLSREQLDRRAEWMVEAQYLRESNVIREQYRREIDKVEHPERYARAESPRGSPDQIRGLFNGLPSGCAAQEQGLGR